MTNPRGRGFVQVSGEFELSGFYCSNNKSLSQDSAPKK